MKQHVCFSEQLIPEKQMLHADQPIRILHLEDDQADAELVRHAMEKSGIDALWISVSGKKDFIDALGNGNLSIILADFNMPGFGGMSALEIAREKHPDVPFVFVSGDMPENVAIETLHAGATDYVFKSKLPRLGPVVRRALDEAGIRRGQQEYAQALKRLQDCTDGISGREYFEQLLRALAEALHVRYAFIGKLIFPTARRVRTIALWTGNGFAENFEYDLAGTPCDSVVGGKECIFPEQASRQFPGDRLLAEMGIESYHGIPLSRRDGTPLGLLSVFDTAPMDKRAHLRPLLSLFAARAALEIERLEAIEYLRESQRRLATLMDHLPGMAYRCANDPQWTMEFASKACKELTGYAVDDLVGNHKLAYADIILPADRRAIWDSVQHAIGAKSRFAFEYRITTASGTVKWVWEQGCGVYDDKGELIALEGLISDITARKQSETARTQLAAIVGNSNDAIISRTLDGTITSWNAGAARLLGYSAAEALGKPATFILLPEFRHIVADNSARALRGESIPAHETRRVTKDGRIIDVLSSNSPIRDELGTVIGISLILHDITTLKRAEADRARLAAIIENANDAIVSRDLNRRILTWNPAAERLFGYTAAEAIGRSISIIIPPDQESQAGSMRKLVMSGQRTPVYDSVRMAKDGHRIDVSVSQSPVNDANGNLTGISIVFNDITGRKRAETERVRLATIVESTLDAIVSLDLHGIVQTWNPGAERLFGYCAKDAVGRDIAFIFPKHLLHELGERRNAAMQGHGDVPRNTERLTHDGRCVPVSISTSPLLDASGNITGIVLIYRDMTEQVLADNALKNSEELLRATFEQAAVGMALRDLDPHHPRWLRVNQKLCDILGYTKEELLQLTSVDITPHEERKAAIEFNEKLLRGKISGYSREKRYVRKDGITIWVNLTLSVARGSDGHPTHAISIIEDISERKHAEEAQALLAAIIESSDDAIISRALDGTILSWNPGAERMLGYAASEAIGRAVGFLMPPGQERHFENNSRSLLEGASVATRESRRITKDGRIINVLVRVSPVKDGAGKIIATSLILSDISAAKQGETERRRLASLVESSHDAVITCTNDWQITSWNASAQRLFGYTPGEALGQDIAMLIPPEMLTEFVRHRVRAGSDKPLESLETEWLDQQGQRVPVLVETWLLPGNDGIAVTCCDMATKRMAAAALKKSEEQFRQLTTNIPEVFWIAEGPGNRLTYISPAFENVWGRSVASVLEKQNIWTDAIHSEDRGRVAAARRLAAQGDYNEEYRVVQPNGTLRWVQDRAFAVHDADGRVLRIAGIAEDITERKKNEERLLHLAHYDQLTSLPNRVLLQDRLYQAIAQASRTQGNIAVLLLDLDHFKLINDTLGHDAGDLLLQDVTRCLQETLRIGDTVARFGGDEFTAILSPLRTPEDASLVAQKMLDRLAGPFTVKGQQVFVSASIGITLYPSDSDDPVTLMKNADIAMYRAKELGRNGYQFFTPELNARSRSRVELETDLRQALQNQEFLLHYQPRVNLDTGRVTGVEALMRWERPGHGLIPPGAFVPVLEDTGLIVPVSEQLFEMACRQLRQWHDVGLQAITMAVNLSARQFQDDGLADTFSRIAASAGVDMKWIEFEITESLLVHSPEEAAAKLRQLKNIGATVAIDDFGTGYSSLSYLTRFPIDCVKIDRSFVRDITTDPSSAAIALAVIGMARRLGLRTVAEGVETEGQLRYLANNGCDEMQGFYFSRPLPPAECESLLERNDGLSPSVLGHKGSDRDRCLMVIDDEPNVLSAISRALKRENYHILTAANAEEALQQLALHRVDVVICDQRMPGISGTELLVRIRQLHPETVRLALSGYTDLDSVLAAVNKGAVYKFMTKPWDDEQLRALVKEAFQMSGARHGATHEPE